MAAARYVSPALSRPITWARGASSTSPARAPRAPASAGPSARPRPGRQTCDGVQGCDGEHEDRGEVEVPAEANVHEERARVQVDLRNAKGRVRRLKGTAGAGAPPPAPPPALSQGWEDVLGVHKRSQGVLLMLIKS